ncbi:hypothetical protein L1887_56883 [Cichorium endivia]|nr:hypothetical protein L1887_56883 [Cichorium endivia]
MAHKRRYCSRLVVRSPSRKRERLCAYQALMLLGVPGGGDAMDGDCGLPSCAKSCCVDAVGIICSTLQGVQLHARRATARRQPRCSLVLVLDGRINVKPSIELLHKLSLGFQ